MLARAITIILVPMGVYKFENKHFFEVVRRDGKVVVEVFTVLCRPS